MKLSDYFSVKRGLATGANQFFVLTPERAIQLGLPADFLVPILPSPRYLPDDQIEADSSGEPLLTCRRFLLACDLPEERVKAEYASLWQYFQTAVKEGISQRYLCRHRTPWYAQESRPPAPFLCTYMGRQDCAKGKPFRFILNYSKATAPNVYLMLYPKPRLKYLLHSRPGLAAMVWQALNEIPLASLLGQGRVYGGGLHKLEPKELANAPAGQLLAAVPELGGNRSRQASLFNM
jgi:adenine-specific DNA-methyltransferase